jgi:DNA-binding NarL/FixJ family response regulator
MQNTIRIGLIDNQEIVRQGLSSLLNSYEDIEVIGQGNCFEDARYICDVHKPHILITDFLGDSVDKGIQLFTQLREEYPEIKLFILTTINDSELINEALRIGVLGYWFKDASLEELVNAINNVHRSQPSLAPDALRSLLHTLLAPPELGYDLTEREREVLNWIAKGYTNRQIAHALFISYSTVKNHVSKVLSKLEVSNRVEAATIAVENKLTPTSFMEK